MSNKRKHIKTRPYDTNVVLPEVPIEYVIFWKIKESTLILTDNTTRMKFSLSYSLKPMQQVQAILQNMQIECICAFICRDKFGFITDKSLEQGTV